MRTAYKMLALVAADVAVEAMVVVWAIAQLGKWMDWGHSTRVPRTPSQHPDTTTRGTGS